MQCVARLNFVGACRGPDGGSRPLAEYVGVFVHEIWPSDGTEAATVPEMGCLFNVHAAAAPQTARYAS